MKFLNALARSSNKTSCPNRPTGTRGGLGRKFGGILPIFAFLLIASLSAQPAVSGTVRAGGWKQNLRHAGLLRKQGGGGLIRATNHVKSNARAQVDRAQAAAQRLRIQVPSTIARGAMNTLEPHKTSLFLDKLALRRDLNPSRFDHYHPVIGPLLNAEKLLKGTNGCDPATIAVVEKALLPDTKYYRYFEARRALDPARFDKYHPLFGTLLAENQRVENLLAACQVLNPPVAQAIPEPGMLTLGMVGAGVLAASGLGRRVLAARGV